MRVTNRQTFPEIGFAMVTGCTPVKNLGSGTFGDVYAGQWTRGTQASVVAVKRLKHVFENVVHVRRAIRELTVMHHLRGHPNIVSLLDVDITRSGKCQGLYIYLELMERDLYEIIHDDTELITESHVVSIGYQIFCALKYIHSANIVHRDLKPSNILVTKLGVVKICDFGLSRAIMGDDYDCTKYTSYVTTRFYRAPEIILTVDSYNYSMDVWAGGCVVAELATRRVLFRGRTAQGQFRRIFETLGPPPSRWVTQNRSRLGWVDNDLAKDLVCAKVPLSKQIPSTFSPQLTQLLESILRYVPATRPTAAEVLQHRFFASVASREDELDCLIGLDLEFEHLPNERLVPFLLQQVALLRDHMRKRR